MKYLFVLIFIIVTCEIYSQCDSTIITSESFIKSKYNAHEKYIIEFENQNFKMYFTRRDLLNIIDTIHISETEVSPSIDLIHFKEYILKCKDTLFFKDLLWYAYLIKNIEPVEFIDSLLIMNYDFKLYYDFNVMVCGLLLNCNFRVFDKQLNIFLPFKKIRKVTGHCYSDDYWFEALMIDNKILWDISSISIIE